MNSTQINPLAHFSCVQWEENALSCGEKEKTIEYEEERDDACGVSSYFTTSSKNLLFF